MVKNEIVREVSFLECTILTCYATNVVWDGKAFHIGAGVSGFKYAGSIVHFGIGRPGAIGYLDTWTHMPRGTPGWLRAACKGLRKLKEEQTLAPAGTFIPIYIHSNLECGDEEVNEREGIVVQLLWKENFFRRIYLGAVAFVTQDYWSIKYNVSRIPLLSLVEEDAGDYEFGRIANLGNESIRFKSVILGLFQKAMLEERTLMMQVTPDYEFLSDSYKRYAKQLQEKFKAHFSLKRRVLAVQRRSNRRIYMPERFPEVYLEDYNNLQEQVEVVNSAENLVVAHGAALTHMFFLGDPKPVVVELFPCGFRKTIYQNLALLLNVPYVYWQQVNNCASNCSDLNWEDQASKDCWRNQDIYSPNIVAIIEEAERVQRGKERYLMYMPWEQMNNQLIAFKCACGVAALLNRTLVIPPIGYRKKSSLNRIVFDPLEYEWEPFEKYYDLGKLPCRSVDYRVFYSLKRKIDRVYFRRQGARYTTRTQVEQYYWYVAGISYQEHRSLLYEMPVYLDSEDIVRYLGKYEKMNVLALGNVFWLYTFDRNLHYPLHAYVDMMSNLVYKQIVNALKPFYKLLKIARIVKDRMGEDYGCTHWRLGDYESKCREELYPYRCWISEQQLIQSTGRRGNLTAQWYVATNEPRRVTDLFYRGYVTLENIVDNVRLDPIESVLVDQWVCSEASAFIGNMYSSLTRGIVDYRRLMGYTSDFF